MKIIRKSYNHEFYSSRETTPEGIEGFIEVAAVAVVYY